MQRFNGFFILLALVGFLSLSISAQTPSVKLDPFLSGLSSPVFLTNAKDGTNRIFVVEKGGIIKVVQPGSTTPTNFLDISSKVSTNGEGGLLGLAFHPQYASNQRFFVYYARASDGAIQIAEYQTSADPNVAGTAEKVLITIPHPTNTNHYGGTIAFGSDGFLYAGTGDGGSGNDPPNNAQNINILLGKFIRIDVDSTTGNLPYGIPSDNPFVGVAGADEIYALGMRNPYRWSFDRGGTHQLWAGDVGQGAIEEVDIINKGGNYGWRIYEGDSCTGNDSALCNPANFTFPIFQYTHAGGRCSIIGGYVYRGTLGTVTNGAYIYGDYCTGEILLWNGSSQTVLLDTTNNNLVSFGEDEAGEIYVVRIGGTVEKLAPLGTTAASVTITGRALTSRGRGIGNVIIRLTDA
ncbi:MAG: PQQ-dependent sugar dehydrogenase, partial [Acidobacteriota bacterium]